MRNFFNSVGRFFKGDPNAVDAGGYTRLQRAILNNDLRETLSLIKAGADVNMRGSLIYPPLHYALTKDCQPIVLALIDAGADVNLQDAAGKTPLHHAVEYSQEALILTLLKMKADPNVKDAAGRTPMHSVSPYHPQIMDVLAASNARINVQDEDGNTPLHRFLKHPGLTEKLLSHHADPNIRNNKGISPYMVMLAEGRLPYYPSWLQKMILLRSDLDATNLPGDNIVGLVLKLETDKVFFAAADRADLSIRDKNGNNVLHALVRTQNIPLLARVLESTPELAKSANLNGRLPLGELVRRVDHPLTGFSGAFVEAARLLLKAGAHADSMDEKNRGLLHHAVLHDKMEFLEEVLLKGASPDLADRDGKTALHLSIERRNLRAMDILLDMGANPDMTDARGWTILDRLAEKDDRDSSMVQRLIVAGGQYHKQLPLHPEAMHTPGQLPKTRLSDKPTGGHIPPPKP